MSVSCVGDGGWGAEDQDPGSVRGIWEWEMRRCDLRMRGFRICALSFSDGAGRRDAAGGKAAPFFAPTAVAGRLNPIVARVARVVEWSMDCGQRRRSIVDSVSGSHVFRPRSVCTAT